eukprot:3558653-Amphidinium_carterae.3
MECLLPRFLVTGTIVAPWYACGMLLVAVISVKCLARRGKALRTLQALKVVRTSCSVNMGDVLSVSMAVSWVVCGCSGEGVVVEAEVVTVVVLSVAEKSALSSIDCGGVADAEGCRGEWLALVGELPYNLICSFGVGPVVCGFLALRVEPSPLVFSQRFCGVKCQGEEVLVVVGERCDDGETLVDSGEDALRGHGTMLEVFVKTTC